MDRARVVVRGTYPSFQSTHNWSIPLPRGRCPLPVTQIALPCQLCLDSPPAVGSKVSQNVLHALQGTCLAALNLYKRSAEHTRIELARAFTLLPHFQ